MIIYLTCCDPFVVFSCLAFCSVSSSTDVCNRGAIKRGSRPNCCRVVLLVVLCLCVSLQKRFQTAES